MKLLVCSTKKKAARMIEALELDKAVWLPHEMGQPLMGQQFERIVVVTPVPELTSPIAKSMNDEYIQVDLSIKLPPGEHVKTV